MIAGIMVTDGGPHSAADWSVMTVSQILKIDGSSVAANQARKLELRLLDYLETRIESIQKGQRAYLEQSPSNVKNPFDTARDCRIDDQVEAIAALAVGTPFEEHFSSADTKIYVKQVLLNHYGTILELERLWYCDTNPDNAHARAFKDSFINKP